MESMALEQIGSRPMVVRELDDIRGEITSDERFRERRGFRPAPLTITPEQVRSGFEAMLEKLGELAKKAVSAGLPSDPANRRAQRAAWEKSIRK